MNRIRIDSTPNHDDTARKDAARLEHERALAAREKDMQRREDSVVDDEAQVLSNEQSVSQREGAATTRERRIAIAETKQVAFDDHMAILQEANARLVIATIDSQKLAEQLLAAQVQLENARSIAEKANLAKSTFLSNMSHELRTPLHAILGFAQLLESGSPPPTDSQNVRLRQIIKAGWYLLELINEVLDLAVIESGKLALLREPVLLAELLHECESMVEAQAQQHTVQIQFLPFDQNWFANADRTRLKQALINLLTNAIKYNRQHGTVVVSCSRNSADRIRISIKDSGQGISPDKLSQLFQPFNRLGQENGAEEGTGIGLVVTKQLVEMMGGTIGVESSVGVGSEFWIEVIGDVMPQLAGGHALQAQAQAQAQAQSTLLYVEDNAANLMLVEQIIEGQPQMRMLSARDANLGIALARTHLPDVILMDINLPGLSGLDALKILQEDPMTKHIPIVALSANAMQCDIEKGLEAGFFRYLTKPIKVDEFLVVLDIALKFSEEVLVISNDPENCC